MLFESIFLFWFIEYFQNLNTMIYKTIILTKLHEYLSLIETYSEGFYIFTIHILDRLKVSSIWNSYQPQKFFVLWVKSIPKMEELSKSDYIYVWFWPVKVLVHNAPMWHLCEIGQKRNFDFFQIFDFKQCFSLLNLNCKWKMCSFEVHYVDVAQKITEL